jgi:DNA-binding MarR family transcriptional regulator
MSKQSAIERAARAAADFGDAADAVRQAAATRLGLNRTDFRILINLRSGVPVSAGALAADAGLSPAATTEAVQRLAARGLLVRGTDPHDRRRAVITITPGAAAELASLFGPISDDGHALLRGYTTAELELLIGFLEVGRRLQLAGAERMRTEAPHPARPAGSPASP